MSNTLTFHVLVDPATTAEAERVLHARGWSIAEAIRVLLTRTAREGAAPFTPTPETVEAVEAGRKGEVRRFGSAAELFADLHAEP